MDHRSGVRALLNWTGMICDLRCCSEPDARIGNQSGQSGKQAKYLCLVPFLVDHAFESAVRE